MLAATDLAGARDSFNVANIDRLLREQHAKNFKITQGDRNHRHRISYLLNPDSIYKKIKETVSDPDLVNISIELISPRKSFQTVYYIELDEHFLSSMLNTAPDRFIRTALETADVQLLLTFAHAPSKDSYYNPSRQAFVRKERK